MFEINDKDAAGLMFRLASQEAKQDKTVGLVRRWVYAAWPQRKHYQAAQEKLTRQTGGAHAKPR
jgi:hypothetical protein